MLVAIPAGSLPEGELSSVNFSGEALDRPALLTIWPLFDITAKGVEPREVSSLRAALMEAFVALTGATGSPWIITENGLILTPSSLVALMDHADEFGVPLS